MSADASATPMMKQYLAMRRELPEDVLLFFRLGGCKRPDEAIRCLIEFPDQYRPMAYAHKDPL